MIRSGKKEPIRLSNIFAIIAIVGLIGGLAGGLLLSFFTPPGKGQTWQGVLLISLLLCAILGRIGWWAFGKRECKQGLHDQDDYGKCRYCKRELPMSEEKLNKMLNDQRKAEKAMSTKKGYLKLVLPSIATMVFMLCFAYWVFISSHADMVNAINSMNETDPNACLVLVKEKSLEQGMNGFMVGSHVVKATNRQWDQFDCIHKPIMDDFNKTCPIGVIPKIHNLDGYLCSPNEVRIK